MKKKLMIGAGLVALAAGAFAAPTMMGDGEMTRAEMTAKVKEHFAQMDKNKDGVLTPDETGGMGGRGMDGHRMGGHDMDGKDMAMGDMPPMPDANVVFDRLDTNKDGSISRDEFAKGREVRVERRIVMRDGDGGDMKMRHGGKPGGRMGMMFKMADTNNDGKVTLAEAEAMAAQHFDKMDANKDGKVTPEERKASRPMMMKVEQTVKTN